ncbi:phage tail protein, partial [Acinetobacter baumannii]
YDAETFGNVAKVAMDTKGRLLKVPTNYNPSTRQYVGMWDGTFKEAYSNNPAWIYYDICTVDRYALGDRLTPLMVDKWSLYRLAQYCDELVPDGLGGQEPRFTCNVYLQSTEGAFEILTKLAGVFRAITFWDGNSIICDADIPQDTYFTYTRANVIDGNFEYAGTRARDRHNVVKIAWDNPANHYKTEYEFVRDEKAIAEAGQVRILEIDAWGCTSRGQAQRAGWWALKSEQLETRTVSFKVGLDGHIPQPGRVIDIADPLFAGRANGGRVSKISADRKSITLDRDDVVAVAGDRLIINGEDGKAQARIVQSISGRVVTVTHEFDAIAAQNVWVIDAQDLATMKFRVISITQDESHQFSVTALQYNPAKFDAIDKGAYFDEVPISIVNPNIQEPVSNIVITSEDRVDQGINVATMVVSWTQAKGAVKYQVEWRKDDGTWIKLPITGNNSAEVHGIYAGQYQARVTAISAFEIASLPTYSVLTALSGKQGTPPQLAFIQATGILFGMDLKWGFPAVGALDTAYTEIQVSPDGSSNIAALGMFAYPTNTHKIQGLQPNLIQFYRARLVDRIGNVGPWSSWTSSTTSADASAVLDILSGKITESQLHQDLQTKIDKIDATEGDIADLIVAVQNVENGVTQERNERIAGDNQVLNQLTIYKVSNDQAVAAVVEDVDVLTTNQGALSTKIDGVFAQVNPPLIGSESDLIGNEGGYAGVWTEQSARIEGDLVQAKRTDTIQTELNGNIAAVQEVTQSVNGLYAQKFIKLDVNGKLAGWGGANNGVESQFIFNFDSIAIGNGSNTAVTYPYIFRTTSFTDPVTGTVFPPAAYLKSAVMDYQSVKTSHIEDLAVKTAKIGDAAVTNAKIDNLSVSTLKIQDEAVTVPSGVINQTERKFYFAVSNSMAGSVAYTQDLVTLNVETQGGKLRIDGSFVFDCKVMITQYPSSYNILKCVTLACRVLVNGTVAYTQEIYPTFYEGSNTIRFIGVTATPVYILPASTGTKTVVLQLAYITKYSNIYYGSFVAQGGFAETPSIITMSSLSTLELKK